MQKPRHGLEPAALAVVEPPVVLNPAECLAQLERRGGSCHVARAQQLAVQRSTTSLYFGVCLLLQDLL